MIDLDALVNDKRFLPWSGWFDDRIKSISEWMTKRASGEWSGDKCAEMNMCAIQQHSVEFKEFTSVLEQRGINGKCLQLGLGNPGASHLVWRNLFEKTLTVDNNALDGCVDEHLSRIPESFGEILNMDSHNLRTVGIVSNRGPFDLLFIDTDHAYHNVRDEYVKYAPLVRSGGIIAFHDTVFHDCYGPDFTVWKFMDDLKGHGIKLHSIGNELGISYLVR